MHVDWHGADEVKHSPGLLHVADVKSQDARRRVASAQRRLVGHAGGAWCVVFGA